MEEELCYAAVSVLVQERSTKQNWQNQEMAALNFGKCLKKENKILSHRKHQNTNTHSCMWFSNKCKNN